MNLIFRDHAISDLIGFVYSGMPPQEAADHLMRNIRESAEPVLRSGSDAVVPIILDGENAWEYYPESGREFLRRFYDALQNSKEVEAVTVSEAIERHKNVNVLNSLVPGSWIHANFNVWIGAPEDNRSWDYLHHARNFYAQAAQSCSEAQRKIALEELFIAEGSDWNWWYGPEHHSANDREFDELYRTHLSNLYQVIGVTPPDYLAQPIVQGMVQPVFQPQSHYIRPCIDGQTIRYFEWMGAAHYTADRRSSSMHGRLFLLESIYAGIDENNVYGRIDLAADLAGDFEFVVNLESWAEASNRARRALRLSVELEGGKIARVELGDGLETIDPKDIVVAFGQTFEFKVPLALLYAVPPKAGSSLDIAASKLRLRCSIWQNGLPLDALPVEGWMELQLLAEEEMELVN